ncbi:MAG TPA: ABC transporter substrate-binding protein [Candidatus Tectomicrobia bacterium]|nr:ABC transporter substrate-binding protein [Candidatus Tectomicrobia bacterium]
MRHRLVGLVLTGALSFVLAALSSHAQPSKPLAHIAYVSANVAPAAPTLEAFRLGLQELGWIEGRNLTLEWRSTAGRDDLLPGILAELLQRKVDVIVAGGPQAAWAAKLATRTIPIVIVGAGPDPVNAGLVASLARPGGNITGLATAPPELLRGKQLELLKEAVPGFLRAGVLWDPTTTAPDLVRAIEEAGRVLAVEVVLLEVRGPEDFAAAFATAGRQRSEALLIVESPLLTLHGGQIAALALENHLPTMALFGEFAEAGGLMTYGPNFTAQARRAASYVDRLLKGAKPSDLPLEQPTEFELVVNLKTAQILGLTLAPSFLFQATRVIR